MTSKVVEFGLGDQKRDTVCPKVRINYSHMGRQKDEVTEPDLAEAIDSAGLIDTEIKRLKEKLKEKKELIAQYVKSLNLPVTTVTMKTPDTICKHVVTDKVTLGDIKEICKILGDDFELLIDVKTTHEPTKKLVGIAVSEPQKYLGLRDHMFIKPGKPTITFKKS